MVNGKWKMVRPKVAQFYGAYGNVSLTVVSGAGDSDYTQQALVKYTSEYGTPITLLHC